MFAKIILTSLLNLVISVQLMAHESQNCHPEGMSLPHFEFGKLEVPLNYDQPEGKKIKLYWEKFPAQKKSRGSVFFLAGGPLPHYLYHGENSPYFIEGLFSDYDFYMFDYRGFNCSSHVQKSEDLNRISKFYGPDVMAKDFDQLRAHLVGQNEKVIIFGGSFGYMLGTQILKDFPDTIEKAILGWGDTNSDWYFGSMGKLDQLLSVTLTNQYPQFEGLLNRVLEKISLGKIILFKGTSNEFKLSRDIFSVYLWLGFSQSVASQNILPLILEQVDQGQTDYLESLHRAYTELLGSSNSEVPPTLQSAVLNYYRCNVFSSRAKRDRLLRHPMRYRYLDSSGLVKYNIQLCQAYEHFPANTFDITGEIQAIDVPILAWGGDRDMFVVEDVKRNLEQFGNQVQFYAMEGWSHDFGPDPAAGMLRIKQIISDFLK